MYTEYNGGNQSGVNLNQVAYFNAQAVTPGWQNSSIESQPN